MKSRLSRWMPFVATCCVAGAAFGQAPDFTRSFFSGATALISGSGGPKLEPDGTFSFINVGAQDPWENGGPGAIITTELLLRTPNFTGPSGFTVGNVEAYAYAAQKVMGTHAKVTGTIKDALTITARASAFTADELTWKSPSHSKLRVTVPIKIDGTASSIMQHSLGNPQNAFARAGFRAVAQFNTLADVFLNAAVREQTANAGQSITPENMLITVDVFSGVPVIFTLSADVTAGANANNTCGGCLPGDITNTTNFSATADFGRTITWGGILSVTDAFTGEPVLDWTVTSRSGADYSTPYEVPEPSSALLIGIAICCAANARRHR